MKNTQEMTRYAIYLAIITLFAQVPQLGFISLGLVAITTLPIIIVPMLLLENNWKATLYISIMWGINAWLAAMLRATTPIALWFRNPLIGLAPRLLAGLAAYLIIRQLIKMSQKNLIKDFAIVNNIMFAITVITFAFVGSSFPNGGNPLMTTIWMSLTGLVGVFLAWKTYKTIETNEGSSCTFVLGFMSGIVIAIVHTLLVLLSIQLFVDDASSVKSFLDYVLKTSAIVEVSVTAFITMSLWPSMSNIKINNK